MRKLVVGRKKLAKFFDGEAERQMILEDGSFSWKAGRLGSSAPGSATIEFRRR